jgi:hypothetical protein
MEIIGAIIPIAILIGLIRAFIYVIDSLGELRSGQKEMREQLERIEAQVRGAADQTTRVPGA